jgi:uncharacterized membrane protein (UPF0127 family)
MPSRSDPAAIRKSMARIAFALVIAPLAFACGGLASSDDTQGDQSIIPFDSTTMKLVSARDTLQLTVELAVTPEQKTMGLMERRHLAENAGMLFVYDSSQPPDAGFWMFRTRIPLDIAFLDSAGIVRATRAMVPCETVLTEGCPTYSPDVPYRYALEVNSGYLQRHGITLGSAALLPKVAGSTSRGTTAQQARAAEVGR